MQSVYVCHMYSTYVYITAMYMSVYFVDTCSICIMSTWSVSDLSRVPRARRQIGYTPNRHDTNGLYPESAWSTYSNFYCNHRYSNTFSLVVRVSCTTAKLKKVLTL